jgi:hypothetical protein
MITGYCGTGEVLPDAIARFSLAYLEQTERDYAALTASVRQGRVHAAEEA